MSHVHHIDSEISRLSPEAQYLVRECAHQLELVLQRYGQAAQVQAFGPAPFLQETIERHGQAAHFHLLPSSLAFELVQARRLDSIRY